MGGIVFNDGYETERFELKGSDLVRTHSSNHEDAIMAENARVRSNGGSRTLSFGKMVLQMSYAQYVLVRKINPALADPDPKIRTAAWQRLARDGGYRNLSVEDR
jgi:hypothetical protein